MQAVKGYRTPNGGYITKKEIIARQKKFKKEYDKSRQEHYNQLKRKEKLAVYEMLQAKREAERKQEAENKRVIDTRSFLDQFAKHNNYTDYITAYDIVSCNYYQLEADIKKDKKDINIITAIYQQAKQAIINLHFNIDYFILLLE